MAGKMATPDGERVSGCTGAVIVVDVEPSPVMMPLMEFSFTVNAYDRDGDCYEEGVFIHVEPHVSLKFNSADEVQTFANRLLNALPEIRENETKAKAND